MFDRSWFPESLLPIERVLVFGQDARETAEKFAQDNHLDLKAVVRQHAGSGVIHCGNARGAGQLTLSNDVITTAAHVFYSEKGELRGDSGHCRFVVDVDGTEISTNIEVATIIAGSKDPYSENAVHDWAVARLARPLREAAPYPLGRPTHDEAIRFVSRGHADWGEGHVMSIQNCRLRDGIDAGSEGTREFSFDCAAGVGASGSALLTAEGDDLLAVFVGFRSVAPDRPLAFSPHHYNFAVTVEGAFRRAVETEAATLTAAQ